MVWGSPLWDPYGVGAPTGKESIAHLGTIAMNKNNPSFVGVQLGIQLHVSSLLC